MGGTLGADQAQEQFPLPSWYFCTCPQLSMTPALFEMLGVGVDRGEPG